ncbi:unnamed protein product [Ilex paraguariensis]|uniref:Uncharacterized protein n=1 Tax=Ilex paraguariensis TaxID=185542 RepID=A0ABC8TY29_9AQUA
MEGGEPLGRRLFAVCPRVLLSEDSISGGVRMMYDLGSCIVPGSTVVLGGTEARASRVISDGSDSKFFDGSDSKYFGDAIFRVDCSSRAVHGEAHRWGSYAKLYPMVGFPSGSPFRVNY